jgi:hypothetical protein
VLTIVKCLEKKTVAINQNQLSESLKQFPYISKILGDISEMIIDEKTSNSIIKNLLIKNEGSLKFLIDFEASLKNLFDNNKIRIINDNGSENTNFVNRFRSMNPSTYISAISEITIANYLLTLFGKQNFQYEIGKKKERKPDFIVKANGKKFDLEQITIMKGTTKESIEKIFNISISSYLKKTESIKTNFHIIFTINTFKMVYNDDGLDIDGSINHMDEYFDKLNLNGLIEILNDDFVLDFDEARLSKLSEEDFINNRLTSPVLNTKENNHESFALNEWKSKIKYEDFMNNPFLSIKFIQESNNKCITFHPYDFYSDNEESERDETDSEKKKKSYLGQVKAAIHKKYNKKQRRGGNPAIILVETFSQYYDIYDDFDTNPLNELINFIKNEIKNYADISGVIVFSLYKYDNLQKTLFDGIYIENLGADSKIRVSNSEIYDLSIIKRPATSLLLKENTINDDDSIDVKNQKIQNLIEISKLLEHRTDRIFYLRTVETLLNNKQIENTIINKFDSILEEYCFDADPEGLNAIGFDSGDIRHLDVISFCVRGLAGSCLCKLLNKRSDDKKILLISQLAKDRNTMVRESIARNLHHVYEADHSRAIEMAKNFLDDNERVIFNLLVFIRELFTKDLDVCLELIMKISNIQKDKIRDSDQIMRPVVSLVVYGALIVKNERFKVFLEQLMANRQKNKCIKLYLIHELTKEKYLFNEDSNLSKIRRFVKILEQSLDDWRYEISDSLLSELVKRNASFLPELNSVLYIIVNSKINGHDYKYFGILNYLKTFWKEMPDSAAKNLVHLIDNNEPIYLVNEFYLVIEIASNIINEPGISLEVKNSLKEALQKLVNYNQEFMRTRYKKELEQIDL